MRWALRAPRPAARDFIPCIPIGRNFLIERAQLVPAVAGGLRNIVGFWPYKIRENPLRDASIPPGIYPGFNRLLRIRLGGLRPPGQKRQSRKAKVSPCLFQTRSPAAMPSCSKLANRCKQQITRRICCHTSMLLAWRRSAATGCEASCEIRGSSPGGMLAFPKGCPRISLGQKPTIFRNPPVVAGINIARQLK